MSPLACGESWAAAALGASATGGVPGSDESPSQPGFPWCSALLLSASTGRMQSAAFLQGASSPAEGLQGVAKHKDPVSTPPWL